MSPILNGGSGGGIGSVAATDASIVVAGTAVAPTVATATLDVIASTHAAAADVGLNSHKITALANGTAATDAAAFGQLGQVLLSSTTLASDTTFDVASISQAFTDLRLVLMVRGTNAANNELLCIRFNNDSTSGNYNYGSWWTQGGAVAGQNVASATLAAVAQINGASVTAGWFSTVEILIPSYTSTAFSKSCVAHSGGGSNIDSSGGGVWTSTAAINRIQILGGNTASLKTASVLRIYGLL